MYSWIPKLGIEMSMLVAAAREMGDRSVGPWDPLRTWYRAARSKMRRRWVIPGV